MEASLKLFDPKLFVEKESISPLLGEKERKAVESALGVAFFASLYANEGRLLKLALLVVLDPRPYTPKLNKPESLTPQMLKVLSPALDPEERCFVVAPNNQEQLEIHAISARPELTRLPGAKASPLVIVDGPGRVALKINDKLVLYDRGEMRSEDEDPLKGLVGEGAELIVSYVSTPTPDLPLGGASTYKCDLEQWNLHGDAFRKHAQDFAPVLVAYVLRQIAKWVKDARHGGALLLLPKEVNPEKVASDGRWFRGGDGNLQDSTFRLAALRSHLDLALQERAWVVDDLRDEFKKDVQRWAREVMYPEFERALLNLDFACQRCARLTEVDGTTILGSDLRVLGFGARLNPKRPSLPPKTDAFLKSRGTRHSSMACTVASVEKALGIVVSQDGNAVAFYEPAGMPLEPRDLIL